MSVDKCPLRWAGSGLVITLPAEIDVNNAEQVGGELLQALDQCPSVLVVDMTATVFCGSAGIHVLIDAHQRAAATGADMRVAASDYAVQRMLELTGADQVIEICPDLQTALAGLPLAD